MISEKEVRHIAKLSRLELTESEIKKMQKDLSAVLDYFELLKKAGLKKAKSSEDSNAFFNNVLRHDEALPKTSGFSNNLIEMAPGKKNGYIKVKNIF